MTRRLTLYPGEHVQCPGCGSRLEKFTQGEGWSLHTCTERGTDGRCGQQMLVMGASGGSAVVLPLSSREGNRIRELMDGGEVPSLRRVLRNLNVYGWQDATQSVPPPIGG